MNGGDPINKREKEILQSQLDSEKAVLKQLEKQYQAALKDINEKVKLFDYDINMLDEAMNQDNLDDAARAVFLSQKRSKAYQKQYQEALQKQLEGILEKLHSDEYATLQQYLKESYNDAFLGTMYDLHGQGIPIVMPINQAAAVKAILTDSKISKGLYTSLGVDVNGLKKTISAEITRGIASGMSYADISRNISNASNAPLSRAKTIARTEAHRIQQASTMDAQARAKEKGADVVKQWDSTLDGATRPTHRKLDGQIREIDEPFEANGKKAQAPGHFGDPAEDCNCRCVSLTRAKWALDEDELQALKDRAEFFGLDKTKDFDDFKEKYLGASTKLRQEGGKAKPPKEYDGAFDDFEELNLNKAESEALTTLRSLARNSGFEYGTVIEKGVVGRPVTSNLADAVKIELDDYGDGLTVLHSHTNATPPSAADLKKLLNSKVDKIGVVGYNGDAYMAYVGEGWIPSDEEFDEAVEQLRQEATYAVMEDPNFFEWSVSERTYMAIREQTYRITMNFGWTMEGGRIDG